MMTKKSNLIYLTGIDGCGKTTLALKLADLLREQNYVYVYGQYIPRLLRPVKWLARTFFLKNENEEKNYGRYLEKKKGASGRHRWLARIYAMIWILDYSLQLAFKLVKPLCTGKSIIMDRYYYDTAVNLAIMQGVHPMATVNSIKSMMRIFTKPLLAIYIYVPEEVAFARKDDIHALEYLSERQIYYQELAWQNEWFTIDGTQKTSRVLHDALVLIGYLDANISTEDYETRRRQNPICACQ
jgi:thymidylate kinase